MNYALMHKDIPVAEIKLDGASCAISGIGEVYAPGHVPVGVAVKNAKINRATLNSWWTGRAIPASRDGLGAALESLGLDAAQKLLDKCLGLSLSDQYWIRPAGSSLSWSQVNFFENPFSGDVGDLLLGKRPAGKGISLMSPDNTSDGWLRKKWVVIGEKRCLIKGGSGATRQEPYNEVLACAVMRRLSIPHEPYTLIYRDEYPYSVCEDFITPQTELVPAWYIMQTRRKPNHVSVYQHYLDCCEALGIPGMADSMDRMIVLDYLIANEDRHQNNFGAVRNADTLKWLGAAPIYDSGTSLWFDRPTGMIRADARLTCKPFKQSHEEQLGLVRSFGWLDMAALKGIEEEFREILRGSAFIDQSRCDALCRALAGRVELLARFLRLRTPAWPTPNLRGDVPADVSYSGKSEEKS